MASSALSSQSSSLSQQLHEKEQLFTDWGLDDDSQGFAHDGNTSSSPAAQNPAGLMQTEKEHRRRSRAFSEAARAAAARKAAEEQAADKQVEDIEDSVDDDDGDDDDVVEVIDLTQPHARQRPRPPRPPRRTVSTILEPPKTAAAAPLRRTNSTPLPETTTNVRGRKRKTDVADADADKARDNPKTKVFKPAKSSKSAKPAKTSKKRDATPPLVPEPQRIFAGLAFYYLPDAALGARRLRIAKARQHGAQWVRSLREASHVVVDKHLAWSEVAAVVRDEGGDETKPILVNEEYPLDCIGFRCLLNPAQRRYRVRGWTDEGDAAGTATAESSRKKKKKEEEKKLEAKEVEDKKQVSPHRYTIKPDRRQQARLGSDAPAAEYLERSRHGGG